VETQLKELVLLPQQSLFVFCTCYHSVFPHLVLRVRVSLRLMMITSVVVYFQISHHVPREPFQSR